MAYSGNPADSLKDAVRFEYGDTSNDSDIELLTDDEIQYVIDEHTDGGVEPTARVAAIHCCESAAAKFAREAATSIGDIRVQKNQIAEGLQKRADQLRRLALRDGSLGGFYYGGKSLNDKTRDREDTDLPRPGFSREDRGDDYYRDAAFRRHRW